jgi:hypothetical protein
MGSLFFGKSLILNNIASSSKPVSDEINDTSGELKDYNKSDNRDINKDNSDNDNMLLLKDASTDDRETMKTEDNKKTSFELDIKD